MGGSFFVIQTTNLIMNATVWLGDYYVWCAYFKRCGEQNDGIAADWRTKSDAMIDKAIFNSVWGERKNRQDVTLTPHLGSAG